MAFRWRWSLVDTGLALAALVAAPVAVLAANGLAVVFAVAALLAVAAAIRDKRPLIVFGMFPAVLSALVLWMFLSVLWSPFPLNVYQTLIRVLPLLFGAGVLVSATARTEAEGALMIGRMIVAGALLLLLMVAIETIGSGVMARTRDHLLGVDRGWSYTYVSQALVVAALMIWPAAIVLWRRGLKYLAGVMMVAAAILPFTAAHFAARGAILVGAVAFASVWLFRQRALWTLGSLAVMAIALAPLLPFGPLNPAWYAGWLAGLRNSAMHRLYIWRFTAERVGDHPVLGWGLNAARSLPGGERETPVGGQYLSLHPHNAGLQIWVELGPVGMVLAVGILILAIRAVGRLQADRFTQAAAGAGLFATFFVAEVSFGIWQSWWLATLALLFCWTMVAARVEPAVVPKP